MHHYCDIVGKGLAFEYDRAYYELACHASRAGGNKVQVPDKQLKGHSDIHENLHLPYLWLLNGQICLLIAKHFKSYNPSKELRRPFYY
jgi:hypothetical protein